MKLKVRSGKINRHERITQILLNGKPTSPEDILLCLKGTDQEKVGYRLATNIYNIRRDGGAIKVFKTGRNVTAYQLLNPTEFNAEGRYIGRTVVDIKPAPVMEEENIVTEELETA